MTTGTYDDWHPVFHTWTNWLITRIWLSPAAIAIAQIVTLSAVLGMGPGDDCGGAASPGGLPRRHACFWPLCRPTERS